MGSLRIKPRLGLRQLSDLTLENILGAKDNLSNLELALQAEPLLKIISNSDKDIPERIVRSAIKVISYCERLDKDTNEKFKAVLES